MTADRKRWERNRKQYRFLRFRGCGCVYDQRAPPLKKMRSPRAPYVAQSAEGQCPFCQHREGRTPG